MASPSSPEILPVNEPFDDNESLASSIVESSIVDTSSEADEDILEGIFVCINTHLKGESLFF